ncbi:MAG: hypothetical protein J7619_00040 [Dyadobacter sp.]|uniref:phage tail tube protein n=1 Tax=Dyadobacter sp. TaxID=1914288 RepID=UPI001B06A136|nr:phage tail tube protein [Dyadobacter sp.]MBO9611046.1 hypothetical protein [Dyadobacter sp.]
MEFNGSEFKAYLAGSPKKLIAGTRNLSLNVSSELLDTTTRDAGGWKRNLYGLRSWTFSMSGVLDWVEGMNEARAKSILGFILNRTQLSLEMGTDDVGDEMLTGNAKVMDFSLSTPHEGVCEWTAEGEGNGALDIETIA